MTAEPPSLLEVAIDVPADEGARAEAAGWALGAQGLEVRDEETTRGSTRTQVLVWLPRDADRAAIVRVIRDAAPGARVSFREIAAAWAAPSPAHPIGRRFAVVALEGAVDASDRIPLRLETSLSFGDAHPTTALVVEAIERAFATRAPSSVLDVGTGTGILAIAAARLGASRVFGVDVDPLALEATRRNARANDVAIDLATELPEGRFELVLANLYAGPLRELAESIAARVSDGGTLVISGFGARSRATVLAAFRRAGLIARRETTREGWIAVELAS